MEQACAAGAPAVIGGNTVTSNPIDRAVIQPRIVDITTEDADLVEQAAAVLVAGFREMAPDTWPTLELAREEMAECLEEGRLVRAALAEDGRVLGWIGGRYSYGRVWELHPLVVDPAQWERGIGRALVEDLEKLVAERGGLTLMLGSDDETDSTSLSGVELYPDVWRYIPTIRSLHRHPYEFYQKLGYVIIGLVPDANGWGKPDILMAKRVGKI